MAAEGYPGAYEKGSEILMPSKESVDATSVIFHAGTKKAEDVTPEQSMWLSIGGRVLGCTALGDSFAQAQDHAYDLVAQIDWPNGFCRTDIGYKAL